jgi:hypothetical protein
LDIYTIKDDSRKKHCQLVPGIVCLLVALLILTPLLSNPVSVHADSWEIETVDSAGDVGKYTSLTLDSGGSPHIAYRDDTNENLKYASFNRDTWDIETVGAAGPSASQATQVSLALDSDDYPHISYYNNYKLGYAVWIEVFWNKQTISNKADHNSLALDSNNFAHIAYSDDSDNKVKYISYNGSGWDTQVVDGVFGFENSLALDNSDLPHISYYDFSNSHLKYASYNGTDWNSQTVDSSPGVGHWSSLALDSNGYPHISYQDSHNSDLKYACFNGTAWDIQTVDSIGSVGQYTSLALDHKNYPHISYYDSFNDNLKYARFNGTTWQIQTVDSDGDVGEFTSLKLDANDNPCISYYDVTNGNLKYARFEGSLAITSINPATGVQGEIIDVVITGSNFVGTTAVSFGGLGSYVTVENFTVDNPTQITASISIFPFATPGTRNVSVTIPGETVTLQGGFTVTRAVPQTREISTATGTGTATFTTNGGAINSLTASAAVPCGSLAGYSFPQGFFSFKITNITPGSTVTVTIKFPSNIPANSQYWKCSNGQWVNVTSLVGDNDGDNILTLTITDGGPGDADGVANGVISDPGGPVVPLAGAISGGNSSSSAIPELFQGNPAKLSVKYLNVQPQRVQVNQPAIIYANIANSGDESGSYTATLKINGQVEETKTGIVEGHAAVPLKFEIIEGDPGVYQVDVNGQQTQFTVIADNNAGISPQTVFLIGIIVCAIGALIAAIFLIRRRNAGY